MRLVLLFVIPSFLFLAAAAPGQADPRDEETLRSQSQLPLHFIENRGQLDDAVDFYIHASGKTLFFTPAGITFSLITGQSAGDRTAHEANHRWNLRLSFADADPDVRPRGMNERKAVFSYFRGKPEEWKTAIPSYGTLVYEDLWPGIDLVYRCRNGALKYEFLVEPGIDPKQIRLAYEGVTDLRVQETGKLLISYPGGSFEDGAPFAFQRIDGEKIEVPAAYRLLEGEKNAPLCYTFDIGSYDPSEPLFLDPVLLIYSGYIGGTKYENGQDLAVDAEGNAYVTGVTDSRDFPIAVGPDPTMNGMCDAFVAKVSAEGDTLLYCGYIGGSSFDEGRGIAVDSQGQAYVTGYAESDETTFPVTVGPDLTYGGGYADTFVAKVNAQGTALLYCGYIGGTDTDVGMDIAVDDLGQVYIAGETSSHESSFPVVAGPGLTFGGGVDGFVAKVNTQGTALQYCGYIGGQGMDSAWAIAVDALGQAHVTGHTDTPNSGFPLLIGPDLSGNGMYDAYVTKVNAQGDALLYSGYIGGAETETGQGIALDGQGHAYITGRTNSDESTFPVLKGPDLTYGGGTTLWGSDGFIAKVDVSGSSLHYCGYIGGPENDGCSGVAVNDHGQAYLFGTTHSDQTTFPVLVGPDLTYNGSGDAFVAKLNEEGDSLIFCGYHGGALFDTGFDIALGEAGQLYVIGATESAEYTFPVSVGPDLTFNGEMDIFISKLALALDSNSNRFSQQGDSVDFYLNAGRDNKNRNYLILGSISGTSPGIPLPGGLATLPLNRDFFTDLILSHIHAPALDNFIGTLDAAGSAAACFTPSNPLPPSAAGLTMHFAYGLGAPYDFASNAVAVEIVP